MFVERSSQVRATKNTWPYYRYRETAGKLNLVIALVAGDGASTLVTTEMEGMTFRITKTKD